MAGTLTPGSTGGYLGPQTQTGASEGFISENVLNSAGTDLVQGEVVRMVADDAVTRAQADVTANAQGTIGVSLRPIVNGQVGPVVTEGKARILLEAALVPVAGQTLYVSPTVAGRATTSPPGVILAVGVIKDASSYATDSTVIADIDVDPAPSTAVSISGGAATWPLANPRFFAVDDINGNDANTGFSDVSLAAAGLVAKKTWAGFLSVIPAIGAGRIAVVGVAPRAAGAAYAEAQTGQFYGYLRLIIRATASFSNTTADKIECAPQIPAGLNAAGYNIILSTVAVMGVSDTTPIRVTTGAAHGLVTGDVVLNTGIGGITSANGDYHVDVFDGTNFDLRNTRAPGQTYTAGGTVKIYRVTLAGGGAPLLPAEPGLEGKRFRYSATTGTVALQNSAASIIRNGTDTIVFAQDPTGGDPAAADIIFIEEPATAFTSAAIWSDARTTSVVGFRYTTASVEFTGPATKQSSSTYPQAELRLSFIDVTPATGVTAINGGNQVVIDRNWTDETGTSITSGSGIRTPFIGFYGSEFATFRNSCAFGTAVDFNEFQIVSSVVVSAACMNRSVDLTACKSKVNSVSSANFAIGNTLGNGGSTTRRRLRMRGVTAHGGVINLVGSDAKIFGVFVESMAFTNGGLQINGLDCVVQVSDLIGLGSDAGPGISFTDSFDAQIVLGRNQVNTIGGSTGIEVRHSGPADNTYANLNITGFEDERGNNVQGTSGNFSGVGTRVNNQSGVTLALGNLVRSNGTTGQVTRPLADTLANTDGPIGVMVTSPANTSDGYMITSGTVNVRMDAAPTINNFCWLSATNAGQGMTTNPTGGNFDLRLGRVVAARVISGVNFAVVAWNPDREAIPTETIDLELVAEMSKNGGSSTRTAQLTDEGGSFWVPKRVRFNRIVVNIGAYTAPMTLKVTIYQAPQGTSGASATAARQALKIAEFDLDPGATGNFEGTVTEAVLEEGLCYVLYGRSSAGGSCSVRVYAHSTVQLENTVVPANTHPLSFSSTITASAATPAAVDTRDTVTLTATVNEVVPIIRLKRV